VIIVFLYENLFGLVDMEKVVITTFYHFINLNNVEAIKEPLLTFCRKENLKGTILIANEGINSTISGSREAINSLYQYLKNRIGINNLVYKESFNQTQPFLKMKVNVKREIVALGVEDLDVENLKGEYISAEKWDEFIAREDVITIDTRNEYEVMLGTFDKAINPHTGTFRQFPQWVKDNLVDNVDKEQKIAMFCTGGIRCEKSTAYLKAQGFNNVYHLEGGVLKYFEDTKANAWHGTCFVFDDRVSLDKNLDAAYDIKCEKCNKDMDTDDVRKAALLNKLVCLTCVDQDAN